MMLEFACHSWAFNDLSLTEALGTMARLGFRYVDIGSGSQLNPAHSKQNSRALAAEIRRDLETFNLKLSDVYVNLPHITAKDEEKRRKEIDLYKAMLPFLVALETPGVTLSSGLADAPDDVEAYDRAVIALREMVEASQSATPANRLRVSIEPHLDSIAQKPEVALRMLNDVPGLMLTLDWAQMNYQAISHDEIIKLLPHTRHIHIRQAAHAKLQTPFEQGQIDLRQVIDALRSAHYEGVVCVEYMKAAGLHGMMEVNPLTESVRLRDALRDARDG